MAFDQWPDVWLHHSTDISTYIESTGRQLTYNLFFQKVNFPDFFDYLHLKEW